jgi:uncharacterized membrane protein
MDYGVIASVFDFQALASTVKTNSSLALISFIGGFILFGFKLVEHFSRSPSDKLVWWRYIGFFLFLALALPLLGLFVTLVYLINGDKISSMLAFQIGISSPAIVQSLMVAAANKIVKGSSPAVEPGQ